MEKDMNELMNKLDMAQQELKDMQQLSNSKALESHQNWEADSGVSSPVLSISTQLDNQSPEHTLVLEIQNHSQELQQDLENVKAKLAEEKGKNNNLLVELRKFEIKKRNWINYYQDLETDCYSGLNFHLQHIYKLEDEC